MIFSAERGDIPDLSGEVQAGTVGGDVLKMSMAVAEEHMAEATVEAAELGEKAKFIAAQNEIRMPIVIDVRTEDGIDG